MLEAALREFQNPSEILISAQRRGIIWDRQCIYLVEGMLIDIEINLPVSTAVYGTPQRSTTMAMPRLKHDPVPKNSLR
jgi:hypothetical protein